MILIKVIKVLLISTICMTIVAKLYCKEKVLHVNDTLVIKLPAKLGTGYSWHLKKYDKNLLKDSGFQKVERIKENEREVIGQTQLQVFEFTAIKPGIDIIRMEYKRIWKDSKPTKTFKLKVNIFNEDGTR